MDNNIDAVDYAVLKCIDESGGCWKKRVHQWTDENIDNLPMRKPRSVQTIGRRIDQLQDEGLLESCILSPDSVSRDMIIGYMLTEDGEQMLEAKRSDLLYERVIASSRDLLTAGNPEEETEITVDRGPLVALMSDAFDIDEETKTDVLPRISTEELVGLLAVHFFLDNAGATFDTENENVLAEFLARTPKFRRPFEKETIISRIRKKVSETVETGREAVQPAFN